MTRPEAPAVSIGMPAYNSERTIRESIDCLLAQDFRDFELVISDNASTDRTWEIISEFAARDPRVVALRQPTNIGANGNYTAVFLAARGRYFKWASSNDWCAPNFVSACVKVLEARPDVVLVAPRTRLFENDIADGLDYKEDSAFEHDCAVQRFSDVSVQLRLNNVLNGVIRADSLRRTRLIEHYRGADVVLVGHLALFGKILLLDEHLFGRRMDRATATAMMSADEVRRHHYPVKTWRSLFPSVRNAAGWLRAASSAGLTWRQRLRATLWVAHLLRWRGKEFRADLTDAIRFPLQ